MAKFSLLDWPTQQSALGSNLPSLQKGYAMTKTTKWQEGFEAGLEAAALWFENHRPTLRPVSPRWSKRQEYDWLIEKQSGNPWQGICAAEIRRLK